MRRSTKRRDKERTKQGLGEPRQLALSDARGMRLDAGSAEARRRGKELRDLIGDYSEQTGAYFG